MGGGDLTPDSRWAAPYRSKSRLDSRQGQIETVKASNGPGWERRMKPTQGMDVCGFRMSGRAKQSTKQQQQQGTIDGGGQPCSVKVEGRVECERSTARAWL